MLPNPDIPHMGEGGGAGGDLFLEEGSRKGGVIKGDGAGEKLIQYPLLLNSTSEIKMTFPNSINFVTR